MEEGPFNRSEVVPGTPPHSNSNSHDTVTNTESASSLNVSSHDGDWTYYKQRVRLQAAVIDQLKSLLEAYGYYLPEDPEACKAALSDHLAQAPSDEREPLLSGGGGESKRKDIEEQAPALLRIVEQGSIFFTDTARSQGERFEQVTKELPQISGTACEIRIKGLKFGVQRAKGAADEPTVGDHALALCKSLACVPCITRLIKGKEVENKTILKDVNAVFKPETTTLVLGPPGCGKSTLLKAMAGLLKQDAGHVKEGEITYNGFPQGSREFSLPKVAHFAEQADRHIPKLTVQETLQFAFDSMSGGTHAKDAAKTSGDKLNAEQKELVEWMDAHHFKVEMILRSLGLYNAKDTIVGNNELRGVSGGERRRVTFGEMLCGPHTAFLMDSISTGLDASTTFDIMNTLKAASRSFRKTVVVALLQPPPETYRLFDNVCLMAGGMILYHGRREDIIPYFNRLGLTCPPRKDEADWLVEITGESGRQYRANAAEAADLGLGKIPSTPEEFHAKWVESETGMAIQQELAGPGSLDGTEWPSMYKSRYAGSWFYHLKLCFTKKLIVLIRDRAYVRSQVVSCVVMALVVGSVFYNLGLEDANAKFGLIFFSLFFLSTAGLAQIPTAIASRGVFYKQSMAGFYPTSCEVVADTLVQTGLTAIESILFAPLLYFLVGFSASDNGARFFIFMVIVLVANINLAQYFRFLASFMPDFQAAQGFGGLSIMLTSLFSGFLIAADSIPGWWIWMFWINPLSWAFRAAVLNEFQSPEYSEVCGTTVADGETCPIDLGQTYIDAYGFADDKAYIWGGILFMFVEFVLCAIMTGLAYRFLKWDASDNAPIIPIATGEDAEVDERDAVAAELFNAPVAELKRQSSDLQGDIPFEPVTLAFRDMSYSVPHPSGDGQLELLSGISGFCKPGEMTALMGSSGAGKTTLLDVLAGRKTSGTITGDIRLNGHPKMQKTFTRVAGYVEQQDVHSTVVTVKEVVAALTAIPGLKSPLAMFAEVRSTGRVFQAFDSCPFAIEELNSVLALMFSASMRLDDSVVDKARRKEFVQGILEVLELDVIADRQIGSDEEGGLSLEQRKRTTLGVELAANPSLIFLDEPTSGLDARSAQVVMRAIRKVAATQRAVICTIHQPSTYLFEMFDALLLLKKGGQVVFFGDLGENSSKLITYLQSVPSTKPIQDNVNPATWMLEVIGAGTSGQVDPQVYADYYKRSTLQQECIRQLETLMVPESGSEPIKFKSVYAASSGLQRHACMRRAILQYWRNPTYNFMRIMLAIIIAFIYGSSFIGADVETEADVASRLGVIYISTMFVGAICFQITIPSGAKERMVFYREQAANMYGVRAYAIGYAIAELPYILFITLAFCCILYWSMGFAADPGKFFFYWLYLVLWVMVMVFAGMMFVMALPNVKVAQTVGSVMLSMFSMFAGFLIGPSKLPGFWLWAYYLNPLHYAFEGMTSTQFRDNDSIITKARGGTASVEKFVYDFFGGEYEYSNRWYDVMGLIIFIVAIRLGYLYSLRYIRHMTR